MDARQVPVEDDHIVGVDVELGRGFQPVAGDVHCHALVAQALGQYVGEGPRVLGHQHSHSATPARGVVVAAAGAASGSPMAARRPPSGRARRSSVPPCASAMAATIESPRPAKRASWPGTLQYAQAV